MRPEPSSGISFKRYDVSPEPTGAIIGANLAPGGAAPTFSWNRNNENANDTFELIIFDDDFTDRQLDIDVPGDVANYTLTAAQWNTLQGFGPGLRNLVVTGAWTSEGLETGPYWSGAEQFRITAAPGPMPIPLPSAVWMGLSTLGSSAVIAAIRRNRRNA